MDLLTAAAEAAQAQQKQVVEIREQLSSLAEQLAEERAAREAEAAKFRAERVALEAKLVAEHAARNALAWRVAELAREVAEDRCARADDHQRLVAIEDAEPDHGPPGLEEPHVRPGVDVVVGAWPAHSNSGTSLAPDGDPDSDRDRGRGTDRNGTRAYSRAKHQHDERLALDVAAAPEELKCLAHEILQLCDANPSGAVLCANLPRQYKQRFRKTLDFKQYGFLKMSALLAKLPGIHFEGTHRAKVSHKAADAGALYDAPTQPPRLSQSGAYGAPPLSDDGHDNPPQVNDAPPPPPLPPRAAYVPADAPSWKAIVAGEAAAPRGDSVDTDDEPPDAFSA